MRFETAADPANNLLDRMWPIGSVYVSVNNVNPATLFGFGTWVAFGTGKCLFGQDTGQTEFDVLEETGGEKAHTLTSAEMPVHNHGITDPGHTHAQNSHNHVQDPHNHVQSVNSGTTGALSGYTPDTSTSTSVTSGYSTANTTATNQAATAVNQSATTGISTNNTGSGTAHNNLPPYVVVCMWKRTV